MSMVVYGPTGGFVYDDAIAQALLQVPGYSTTPPSNTAAPTSTTGSFGYDPGAAQQNTAFDQSISLGNLTNNTTNAEANMLTSQSGALGTLGNLYLNFTGPKNEAQFSNAMRGQPDASGLSFVKGVNGLGLPGFQPIDPSNLEVKSLADWLGTSSGDSGSGSDTSNTGGSSKIDWKNEREAAGIRADDSNPEIDRQFKSDTPVTPEQVANMDTSTTASDFYNSRDSEGNSRTTTDPYGNPINRAMGGPVMGLARHPQTVHVGEGGRDELLMVIPLQNPARPVPRWAASAANAMVPGSPYAPRPATTNTVPAYARGFMHGIHLAMGGTVYGGGGGYGEIVPNATVNAPDALSDTSQVSYWDNGQQRTGTLAETQHFNPPNQWSSQAINQLTPAEIDMMNSILAAQGYNPQSEWAAYQQAMPSSQRNLPAYARLGAAGAY